MLYGRNNRLAAARLCRSYREYNARRHNIRTWISWKSCDAKGIPESQGVPRTHDISWATYRWVKVHFHHLSIDGRIPLGIGFYLPPGESLPEPYRGFNWKPSGRPPRDTAARSFYERLHITHKYTYTHQYVHVLFLVPRKLIIYSCASSLCSWVIKPSRYSQSSNRAISRAAVRLRCVPCASHGGQSVGHRSWITFLRHFSAVPFCPVLLSSSSLALRSPQRSDCTGNRGR